MTFTTHGHQITGSPAHERPDGMMVARCGGPGLCPKCSAEAVLWQRDHYVSQHLTEEIMADNLKGIPFSSGDEGFDFPALAKHIVFDQATKLGVQKEHPTFSESEVYVVWFAYTLGSWKALCSTSLPDGRYYEVTYSKERGVGFVDTYMKTHNVEFHLTDG